MASAKGWARPRLEISAPQDFEHFLHIGVQDVETGVLEVDQNSTFLDVVERRHRKLPKTPKRESVAHIQSEVNISTISFCLKQATFQIIATVLSIITS